MSKPLSTCKILETILFRVRWCSQIQMCTAHIPPMFPPSSLWSSLSPYLFSVSIFHPSTSRCSKCIHPSIFSRHALRRCKSFPPPESLLRNKLSLRWQSCLFLFWHTSPFNYLLLFGWTETLIRHTWATQGKSLAECGDFVLLWQRLTWFARVSVFWRSVPETGCG